MRNKSFRIVLMLLSSLLIFSGCSTVISDNSVNENEKQKTQLTDYDLSFITTISSDIPTDVTEIELSGNKNVYIDSAGDYLLSGSLNGSIIVGSDDNETIQLYLNNVTISSNDFASIYVADAESVVITLVENSVNKLTDSSQYKQIDDNNVDALIFSKSDLVINGKGKLSLKSSYNHGIVGKDTVQIISGNIDVDVAGQGICGKDALKICGGSFYITSCKASLISNNDEDAYCGCIYITDGDFVINSSADGLHCVNLLRIDGGSFSINCNDDAFHVENQLIINAGTIEIQSSYEGLEGQYIYLNGGQIDITAKDDGINAVDYSSSDSSGASGFSFNNMMNFSFSSGTDCGMYFNGSTIVINAGGDGVDSNGEIEVNDGSIIIYGPSDNGNAAFDYETAGYANGGELIAIGTSGMAENFSSDSSQCTLLYNFSNSYSANKEIKIYLNDEMLYELTSIKTFNSILLTSNKLSIGDQIKIQIDDDVFTYQISSTINSNSNSGGMGGFSKPGSFKQNNQQRKQR